MFKSFYARAAALVLLLGALGAIGDVVFSRPMNRPTDFGADPTGVADSTAAIQACIVACRNYYPVDFSPGRYRITDTIKVTLGASSPSSDWDSVEIIGAGGLGTDSGSGSVQIVTDFTTNDRPAMSIQGAREVKIKGIEFLGENVAPLNDRYTDQTTTTDTEADWVTAGCSVGRYNPYCAIAIDPYSGTEPVGGYDNDDYGRISSIGVSIEDCVARQFCVGFAVKPSDNTSNAEWMTFKRCMARHCTYGWSIGNSQARGVSIEDPYVWNCMTGFEGLVHGQQQGTPPMIRGGVSISTYRLFRFAQGFGHLSMSDFYAETLEQIGIWGIAAASTTHTASIRGSHFKFRNNSGVVDANDAAYHLAAFAPVDIESTTFNMPANWFNVVGASSADVGFRGCAWLDVTADNSDVFYVGLNAAGAGPKVTTENSAFRTNSFTENSTPWNAADTSTSLTTLPARLDLSLHSRRVDGPQYTYSVANSSLASSHYGINATASGYGWVGSTLTFTASNGAEFAVGDRLYWQTSADPWISSGQFSPVALKVTNVSSNTITATALCGVSDLDTSYNPGAVTIAYRPYAHTAPVTGTVTSASASVTGVTSATSYFKVGDFISGTGIPLKTRVTNVSGTTVTLSKNATASNSNVYLYLDRVVNDAFPVDSPNAFWAAQDNVTDDAKSILACLQFWKRCQLLGGTAYRINTQLVMPSNTTLVGDSFGNAFLQAETGFTSAVIKPGSRCTVRDLQVTGNDEATSIGIQPDSAAAGNVLIDRVLVADFAEGIVFDGTPLAESHITNSRTSSCTSNGIRIGTTGPYGISVVDTTSTGNVTGLLVSSAPAALRVAGGAYISNSAHGISVTGSALSPSIIGAHFGSNTTADIAFSGNVRAAVVSGNNFAGSALCFTASNGKDCSIFGNTFNGTVSLTLTNANATRYSIGENTYLADAFDYGTDNSGTRTRYLGSIYSSGTPNGTGPWALGEIVYHSAPASGVTPMGWVCTVGHASSATFVALPTIP